MDINVKATILNLVKNIEEIRDFGVNNDFLAVKEKSCKLHCYGPNSFQISMLKT